MNCDIFARAVTKEHEETSPESDYTPMQRFFGKMAAIVLRRRWIVLALALVLTVLAMGRIAADLRVDATVEAFVATDDPSQRIIEEYRDEFGRDDVFLVVVEGDVFSMPYLERLEALHNELSELDVEISSLGERRADRDARRRGDKGRANDTAGVSRDRGAAPVPEASGSPAAPPDGEDGFDDGEDGFGFEDEDADGSAWAGEGGGTIIDEITSLINVRRTRSTEDGIEVGEWMDPFPTASQLPGLQAEILAERTLVGRIVGKRGEHSVILLRTGFMSEEDSNRVHAAIAEIVSRHEAEGFTLLIGGEPALNATLNRLILADFSRLLGLALLLMLITLLVIFRHPLALLGPAIVVIISAVWTFASMAMMGIPMTMLTNILPVFIISVSIGDSVHVQSVYRDLLATGLSSREAIHRAVATTGLPCLLTSATTAVGLFSFNLSSVGSVGEMGTAGALSAIYAFLASVTLLPIALSFNKKGRFGHKGKTGKVTFTDRLLAWLAGLSAPTDRRPHLRRRIVLTVLAVIVVGSIVSALNLRVWHDPVEWLPAEEPTVKAMDRLNDDLGGAMNLILLIKPKSERGMKDRELLTRLETLEGELGSYDDPTFGKLMGPSISVLDVIKETNRALHQGDAAHYSLPESQRGVAEYMFLFESQGRDEVRRLATTNLDMSHLTFQLDWLEATSYGDLIQYVRAAIDRNIPPEVATVEPTGSLYTVVSVVSNLISDLIRSFAAALAIIALLMIVLFRSVKLGLVAMVPNVLPGVTLIGGMAMIGIPLDLNNLLIGSIVLGLAVDDTIHFFHHYQDHYRRSGNVEESISYSLSHSGRALLATSIILCSGFLIYTTAVMNSVVVFGVLTASAIALALLIDLIFGSALLRAVFRDRRTVDAGQLGENE